MQGNRDSARICVLGVRSRLREAIVRELQKMCFEVTSRTAKEQISLSGKKENYVIIVPDLNQDGSKNWQEFLELIELLEIISAAKPQAALLVSGTEVYGKVFGSPHALKEDELGYVCHTDAKDTAVQCMRTAEHLCSRLAREEGFPVKIVRIDRSCISEAAGSGVNRENSESGSFMETLAETMLGILQNGVPGEAYNLSGVYGCEMTEKGLWSDQHSPLSPISIVPDTGKAGML